MSKNLSLIDRIDRIIGSDEFNLPVFNEIALRIRKIVATANFSAGDIEKLISSDQSLASEVLRVANSPFYCGLTKVTTVREAVVRLGARPLADVVTLASERNRYSAKDPEIQAMMVKLWKHAVGVALASQWLARRLGYAERVDESLLGGLIHDIGKLGVLKVIDYLKDKESLSFQPQFVIEVVDSVHAEVGHKLAVRWGLPENYCLIIRDHHNEKFDQSNHVLMLVRLADAACNKLGISLHREESLELPVLPEAHLLGVGEVVLAELEIMLEDTIKM